MKISARRWASIAVAATCALVLTASPAFAWEAEGGTKLCGSQTGKTHARYNDIAAIQGPGSSTTGYYTPNDGSWHVQERWGVDGGGDWLAMGDPQLDLVNTWAYCVAG